MNDLTPVPAGGQGLLPQAADPQVEEARAMVLAAYHMAVMRPRSVEDARARILEACRRPRFAAKARYEKPVGGKKMKGPSVRFAELALREWGNVHIRTPIVGETELEVLVRVDIIDLETNIWHSSTVKVPKYVERKSKAGRDVLGEQKSSSGMLYLLRATSDEMRNNIAREVSFSKRNDGLRLIPADIIDEAMEVVQATLTGEVQADPAAAMRALSDAFGTVGVKPRELERHLGHPLETASPVEIISLRDIYTAIRDGETTWAATTASPEDVGQAVEATGQKLESLKKEVKGGEN